MLYVVFILFAGCTYGDIRLVNGSNIYEGRVEVCVNNRWGTVCDDLWDTADAEVVCRQLEYNLTSDVVAYTNAYFGQGTGPIWLDGVQCTGSETHLVNCTTYQGIGRHNCGHHEDAGVDCRLNNAGKSNNKYHIATFNSLYIWRYTSGQWIKYL